MGCRFSLSSHHRLCSHHPPTPQTTQNAAKEQLITAMREMADHNGKEMFARAKLMLVGEGRAGKTTTLNSLLGKQFNERQHSTQGADSHDMAVTVDSMDVCKWKVCF